MNESCNSYTLNIKQSYFQHAFSRFTPPFSMFLWFPSVARNFFIMPVRHYPDFLRNFVSRLNI